jgi:exodeoxyribonuclease VII large subunit
MFEKPAVRIFSITEITQSIKGLLETEFPFATVAGEVSNLRRPYSGHLYFTIKDDNAQLKAVLFKQQQRYLSELPTDGQQVVCRGRISVYEPRGEYQLIVDFLQARGAGPQQALFEQLKKQLAAEGLFAAEHKKAIPFLPEKIGLLTSPDGAALYDFLKVALSRFPAIPIEILPVRVQGEEAANEIINGLDQINKRKSSEVIVICRGGGSLEDLWPFNEERLARAIHASEIPVVSAVGHEIDFTIADFVADLRAPTPSAAAEAIVPDIFKLRQELDTLKQRMFQATVRKITELQYRIQQQKRLLGDPRSRLIHHLLHLDHARTALLHAFVKHLHDCRSQVITLAGRLHEQNPARQLEHKHQWLNAQVRQLRIMMGMHLARKKTALARSVSVLTAVNPRAVLCRGYSIVRSRPAGELIYASKQTTIGQALEILLAEGSIGCEVTDIKEE